MRTAVDAAIALVCLLSACGGSSDSSPTPPAPTPPTPPTVPATIAIVAGDGQSAAAGQQLAVAPAVVVRTASGPPVAGTAVQERSTMKRGVPETA